MYLFFLFFNHPCFLLVATLVLCPEMGLELKNNTQVKFQVLLQYVPKAKKVKSNYKFFGTPQDEI